jgi:cell division septation protein DedD
MLVNTEKSSAKRQRYTFDFSLSGLVSLLVFSTLIMVWMFILGILVGRGYQPENVIPQLARVLPQERQQPPAPEPPAEPRPVVEQQHTLRPDELGFHEDLRKSEKRPAAPAAAQKSQPASPKSPEPLKPSVAQPATPPALPKVEAAPAAAVSPKADVFRYIYQVAAFKEEDRATVFRDQARAKGFSAFYAREPVGAEFWFRVMVTLDGTVDEVDRLRTGLANLGVKTPLLRSKKPL